MTNFTAQQNILAPHRKTVLHIQNNAIKTDGNGIFPTETLTNFILFNFQGGIEG